MDLENSVIVPQDTFAELQTAAYSNQTLGERAASVAQTTAVFGAMGGAFVLATWGWAKAMDWRDERAYKRTLSRLNETKSK